MNQVDFTILIIIIGFEVSCAVLFLLGYYVYNKNRYTVCLCEYYLDKTYRIKKELKIPLTNETFKWGDYEYKVNFDYAIIDKKNKPRLFYNYEACEPIQPFMDMEIEKGKSAKIFKVAMDGNIMKHLSNRKMQSVYMYIIMGCVAIVGIVAIYSIYNMSQQNDKMITITRQLMNITRQVIKNDNGVIIP